MNYIPTDAEIRDLFSRQNKDHAELTAAIAGENLNGFPSWHLHIMSHKELNRLAAMDGMENPDYVSNPREVYRRAQKTAGATITDQWIPENPLTMGQAGYEHGSFSATTGAKVVLDGMEIEEPEDVVDHLEKFVFPRLQEKINNFDKEARIREIGLHEYNEQMEVGLDMLKTGYNFITFPIMDYYTYGYENYFCAFLMYEDVIEQHFKLQAELCRKNNEAAAEAYNRYDLPKLFRLDHDMCDGRGTMVSLKTLEKIWFPKFDYALEPIRNNCDCRMIWHCDGNIMPMVPGLLECGVRGFQGFQYEYGVDYAALCKLRGYDGGPMFMSAGVSVTRTLPHGTPADVRRDLDWLVEARGDAAITLAPSSSILPGVTSENIDTLIAGLKYYHTHKK